MVGFDLSKRGYGPCLGPRSQCEEPCGKQHFYITYGDFGLAGLVSFSIGTAIALRMLASRDSEVVQISSVVTALLVAVLGAVFIVKNRVTPLRGGKPSEGEERG